MSFVARGRVLYCSRVCAWADDAEIIGKLDPKEFSTEDFGALFPVCEYEYPEFSGEEVSK
jgi:hypothetical protein